MNRSPLRLTPRGHAVVNVLGALAALAAFLLIMGITGAIENAPLR